MAEEKVLVTLTREELEALATEAALKGAAMVMDSMAKTQEEKLLKMRKRRLHNTRLLLRNYVMMKENCEEAVYRRTAAKSDFDFFQELMSDRDKSDEMIIASIRESSERTALILSHIDKMIAVYKDYCSRSGDRERRQYKVMKSVYLLKSKKTVRELAEEYSVTDRTIQKDREIAEERLSVLFFGIDGLRFSDG